MSYKCTVNDFMKSVKDHDLSIVYDDDGVNRHIKFRGDSMEYWYDLITWKGSLCINGDHGTYVFSRTDDMFTFFRSRNEDLIINPGYWGEKVESQGIYGGGVKKFSIELFRRNVKEYFEVYFEDESDEKIKEFVWDDIDSQLMTCENEIECVSAMWKFHNDNFEFTDFWEYECEEYTYHYIWCLYAIVYGIKLYDKQRNVGKC